MTKFFICIIVAVIIGYAAELTVEPDAASFIESIRGAHEDFIGANGVSAIIDESMPLLQKFSNVGYEVINLKKEVTELSRLQNLVADGSEDENMVKFDVRDGRYFFLRPYRVMRHKSESEITELGERAKMDIARLLGHDADLFIMANTETSWVQAREDPEPRMLAMTYRFTRKINGRHIVDNTAYVRITYSGDDQLCGFEIVNPHLRPVRIPMMVKRNVIGERLNRFAEKKNTVRNSVDGDVIIDRIAAEKGIQSYCAKKKGDKTFLSPYISFFCRYNMENGDMFRKFEHFSLDATRCENLDDSFLDIRR